MSKQTEHFRIFGMEQSEAKLKLAALTPQQLIVAERIAFGVPSRDVISELGIALKTLDIHRSKLLARLDVPVNGVGRIWFCAHYEETT